jgi:hypothetical protein
MDDRWQKRDKKIRAAAGRQSDFSGAGVAPGAENARDHGFICETLAEALAMKDRLNAVEGVVATIRES